MPTTHTTTREPAMTATSILQFDYSNRTFTAEISSTNGLGRIWDDACDEGLTVVNPATGNQVTFVVTDEHHDREGDLTHWTLASVAAPCRTGSVQDGRYSMTLFND